MPKYAQLPDKSYVQFPDDWSEQQMDEAVYRDFADQFPDREAASPGIFDTISTAVQPALAGVTSGFDALINPPGAMEVEDPDSFLGIGKHFQNLPDVGKMILGGLMQTAEDPLLGTKTAVMPFLEKAAKGEELSLFDQIELLTKGVASFSPQELLMEKFGGGEGSELSKVQQAVGTAGQQMFAEGSKAVKENQPKGLTGSAKFGSDVVRAVIEMAPAYTLAFLTKNPAMVPAVMSAQVKGRSFGESRELGLEPYKANARSNFAVFAEGVPEAFPAIAILNKVGAVSKMAWGSLGEGAQEMVTSVLQDVYDKQELENMTLKEAISSIDWGKVLYEGAVGAGTGGALGATVSGAEAIQAKGQERQQEKDRDKKVDEALHTIAERQARESFAPDKTTVEPTSTQQQAEDVGPPASPATARVVADELLKEVATKKEAAQAAINLGGRASGAQQLTEEQARDEEIRIISDRLKVEQEKQIAGESEEAYTLRLEELNDKKDQEFSEAEVQRAQQATELLDIMDEIHTLQQEEIMKPTAIQEAYTKALDDALVSELKKALPAPAALLEHKPAIPLPEDPSTDLYNIMEDPQGIKAQSEITTELGNTRLDPALLERNIRDAGYKGYVTETPDQQAKEVVFPEQKEGDRRQAAQTIIKDKRAGVERRADTVAREQIKGMSREALESHVLNHELTGVKGRFSFEAELPEAKNVVSIDADSLKWINDNISHESGDVLLQNIATALLNEFGHNHIYHTTGDEFYVLDFDEQNADLLKEGMQRVNQRLAESTLTAELKDGSEVQITGVNATAGFGSTKQEADNALTTEKQSRQESGERAARGEQPPGAVIKPPARQPDIEGQVTEDEGGAREEPDEFSEEDKADFDLGTLHSNPIGAVMKGWEALADGAIKIWNDAVGWRYGPLGKLPSKDLYLSERYLVLGRIANVDTIARDVYDVFRKASEEDQRAVYDYLTTPGATPNIIKEAIVRKKAVDTKKLINKTGAELVARGLLSEAAFLKNTDGYLPITYLKYLLGENIVSSLTGGKKVSKMDWSKARDESIPDEVKKLILGEITDPAYLASKGLGTELRDIAIIDFLDFISQKEEWVHANSTVEWKDRTVSVIWLDEEVKRLKQQAAYYTPDAREKTLAIVADMEKVLDEQPEGKVSSEDYRQVPVSKRYGRLRGMYVRKEIYNDLLSTGQIMPGDADFWESWFGYGGKGTKVTQLWKMSKVALNPPAQIRNAASNLILLHMSGIPAPMVPIYVARAAKQIRTDGRYWRLAKKHGVTESTFAAQELFRIERDLLDLESRLSGKLSVATLKNFAGIIGEFAGDTYQNIEALGKTAKIMHAMESQKMNAADAAMEAQKWLFDYSLVPTAVRTARNMPMGVPFITFYYKVLPRLLETAIKRPWAYAPYIALPSVMAMFFAETNDVDDEDAKQLMKSLPMWLQKRGNAFLYPYKDEAGRWQPVDFSYVLPWSMFVESGRNVREGDFKEAVKSSGIFGGPIPSLATAIKTNRDPYTGREIVPAGANPKDQVMGMLTYMYQLAMPTWLTNQGFAGKMLDSINKDIEVNNEMGRTVLTPGQATLRLVGVNVYPLDPERSRGKNMEQMQREIEDIRTNANSRMKQALGEKGDPSIAIQEITDDMAERIQEVASKIQQYAEGSEVPEKLILNK